MYQLLPYAPPPQTSLPNLHLGLDMGTEDGEGELGDPVDREAPLFSEISLPIQDQQIYPEQGAPG